MALTRTEIESTANRFYDDVYKFCIARVQSIAAAEELTQEVFLLFLQKAGSLNNKNLQAWLYQVAGNKVNDYFRRLKAEACEIPLHEAEAFAAPLSREAPPTVPDFEALLTAAQKKILSVLSEEERKVFIKRYMEKKTVSIVCEETGGTANDVYVRSYSIKKKAKKVISGMDLAVSLLLFKCGLFEERDHGKRTA